MSPCKLLPFCVALALTGCSLAPDYQRPAMPVPQQFSLNQNGLVNAADNYQNAGWRTFFVDNQVKTLISEALVNNRDLRMATLKVQEARAQYRLTDDNRISITYRATVDKPCPVNLTNHAYFNLDGNQTDVRSHKLQILADEYLPVDEMGIPYQALKPVSGNSFDFRQPKTIAQDFLSDDDQRKVKGYDHAFLLQAKGDLSQPAAQVWSADEKLQMTVYTTAPALQFYSGNYLEGTTAREHDAYGAWQGLALESEFLPDTPNHPEWPQPDCVLRPGEEYVSVTEYHFIPRA